MADKKLTAKSFLTKTNQKAAKSAVAFIAAYHDYLLTGEIAPITAPIVLKVDAGELQATPALDEIRAAVWAHIQALEVAKAEKQIEKQIENANNPNASGNKIFMAMVVNGKGELQYQRDNNGDLKPMKKNFDLPQEAYRWMCRQIFGAPSDWIGISYHFGNEWETVDKDLAVYEILKKGPRPAMKKDKKTSARLGNNMKAVQKMSHFSHG